MKPEKQAYAFLIPDTGAFVSGGTLYNRHLIDALRDCAGSQLRPEPRHLRLQRLTGGSSDLARSLHAQRIFGRLTLILCNCSILRFLFCKFTVHASAVPPVSAPGRARMLHFRRVMTGGGLLLRPLTLYCLLNSSLA